MAHIDDKNHAGDFNNAAVTVDYSSGDPAAGKYAFFSPMKKLLLPPDIDPVADV